MLLPSPIVWMCFYFFVETLRSFPFRKIMIPFPRNKAPPPRYPIHHFLITTCDSWHNLTSKITIVFVSFWTDKPLLLNRIVKTNYLLVLNVWKEKTKRQANIVSKQNDKCCQNLFNWNSGNKIFLKQGFGSMGQISLILWIRL